MNPTTLIDSSDSNDADDGNNSYYLNNSNNNNFRNSNNSHNSNNSNNSDNSNNSNNSNDSNDSQVLLVGRMGLKSVQVRAGVGMKVVDGTLQRSRATAPSKSSISAGKKMAGSQGSTSSSAAAAAAAAAGAGGDAARMTPEFVRLRPALYLAAWAAMVEASAFEVDASGDVAPAFVQV